LREDKKGFYPVLFKDQNRNQHKKSSSNNSITLQKVVNKNLTLSPYLNLYTKKTFEVPRDSKGFYFDSENNY